MQHRPSRRAGFSLIEIMIAMFILGLGMIMLAGALPIALKSTAESADLTTSTMVARNCAQRLMATGGNINFPVPSTNILWYGPAQDQYAANGVSVNPQPWVVNDPANWGVAIPYGADSRYACQLFYRRRGTVSPYDWDIFVVVQTPRNGNFQAPVDTTGQAKMTTGDIYCDTNGVWRRFTSAGATGAGTVSFFLGVPGGVMVYQTEMRF